QVIVSYFEAGRICDYIKSRWGDDKLLSMVHSFAQRKTTAEVIRGDLGMAPEEFDKQFELWLNHGLSGIAASLDQWRRRSRRVSELAERGDHDQVIKEGDEVRRMYPQNVYGGNPSES